MASKFAGVYQALAYSDLFDFPLSSDELWTFLPTRNIKKIDFEAFLKASPHLIINGGYIAFKGREEIIKKRQHEEKNVEIQREKARRIAKFLRLLPWVLCVCLSGSLAAGQMKPHDDIDFFIITKPDTLWLSRVCILSVLTILGKRRRKDQVHAPGSICVNMIIDTTALDVSVLGKDIYIAREIAQLHVLENKSRTYEQFLSANRWVHEFLPQVLIAQVQFSKPLISPYSRFLNGLAYYAQMKHMKKTKTTELVTEHMAAFHPGSYHQGVLARLEARYSTIPH